MKAQRIPKEQNTQIQDVREMLAWETKKNQSNIDCYAQPVFGDRTLGPPPREKESAKLLNMKSDNEVDESFVGLVPRMFENMKWGKPCLAYTGNLSVIKVSWTSFFSGQKP